MWVWGPELVFSEGTAYVLYFCGISAAQSWLQITHFFPCAAYGLFSSTPSPYSPSLDCFPGNLTDFLSSFPTKLNFLNILYLGLILDYIKEYHHLLLLCVHVYVYIMYVRVCQRQTWLSFLRSSTLLFIYLINYLSIYLYYFETESLTCLELTK